MSGLYDPAKREEILVRMADLKPDTARKWGTMEVPEMLAHQVDTFLVALGRLESGYPINSSAAFYATRLGRWLVIYSPLPWPKGKIKSPDVFFTGPAQGFEQGRQRITELVAEFGQTDPQAKFGQSPLLGDLTGQQWADMIYRHLDHHWRQFGI